MSRIINLRGTNASGKSTAVRSVMNFLGAGQFRGADGAGVPAYRCETVGRDLIVIGRYDSACGGCDALSGFDEIKTLVKRYAALGDVLFEGVLWSTVFKSTVELANEMGTDTHQFIFATLDTPVDTCVARLRLRNEQKAAATGKPVKYANTDGLIAKHRTILRCHDKLKAAGLDARMVYHNNAVATLLTWIDGRQCPACDKPGFTDCDGQPDEELFHGFIGAEPVSCDSDHAD